MRSMPHRTATEDRLSGTVAERRRSKQEKLNRAGLAGLEQEEAAKAEDDQAGADGLGEGHCVHQRVQLGLLSRPLRGSGEAVGNDLTRMLRLAFHLRHERG